MAVALLDTVLGSLGNEEEGVKPYEILETYKGKELEGKEYEPLYECAHEKLKSTQERFLHYM